jgi:hypothetical protein
MAARVEHLLASSKHSLNGIKPVTELRRPWRMSPNFSSGACLGHYEIKRQLEAGGRAEMYLAQDTKLDRSCFKDSARRPDCKALGWCLRGCS